MFNNNKTIDNDLLEFYYSFDDISIFPQDHCDGPYSSPEDSPRPHYTFPYFDGKRTYQNKIKVSSFKI